MGTYYEISHKRPATGSEVPVFLVEVSFVAFRRVSGMELGLEAIPSEAGSILKSTILLFTELRELLRGIL